MWENTITIDLLPLAPSVGAIVGWALAVVVAIALTPMLREVLLPRDLADVDPASEEEGWPTVAVVVPARDEEPMIRRAIESLLAVDYPALTVVTVDDRSTDRTGEILDELAAVDDRLVVVHVTDLPPGWLGKNHANWVGAERSDSDWILFTDGDVVFEPDVLRRAITFVRRHQLDHLALGPGLIPGGLWENVMARAFLFFFTLWFRPWAVRRPRSRSYIGIGAFNLVRRSAYERIGTHRKLAMEVTDDTKLGKLIKRAGLRQDALNGDRCFRVRWQRGLRGIVRGLEKNAFAAFNYSLMRMIATTLPLASIVGLTYAAAALGPGVDRLGYLIALAIVHLTFALVLWRGGIRPVWTVLLPVMCVVQAYIIYRSAYVTLRQGGIIWRDTYHPLSELRKGLV